MIEKGRSAAALAVAAAALLWGSGSAAAAQSGPPRATPADRPPLEVKGATRIEYDDASQQWAVSYTHLTLPTICSV